MRLVLDTNVLIAAMISRGQCHELLEHCAREHRIVVSDHILGELKDKLTRKFRVPPADAEEVVRVLESRAEKVEPPALPEPACRDPDDDWVLSTAVAGVCTLIVTGDKDLLSLGRYGEVGILAPGAFWAFESARREPS